MAIHDRILSAPNRLILQDGGTVDRPEWECDVVTAKFECKTTLIQKLIPVWGANHPTFNTLTKVSHRLREARSGMTALDVTYRGLVDGKLPPVRVRNSLALVDVQLRLALSVEGLSEIFEPTIEVGVYLPQTQYDYFTTKKPKGPKYRGKVNYVEGSFEIGSRKGSQRDAKINIIVGENLQEQMAGGSDNPGVSYLLKRRVNEYNGVAVVVTTNYDDDQVAKNLWKVTETSGVRILPPSQYGDRFIQLSGNSVATV